MPTQKPPETEKPAGLHAALVAASQSITGVRKTGRNTFHGYDYATDEDITRVARKALLDNDITLLVSVANQRAERTFDTRKGNPQLLTLVDITYTLTHAPSGESFTGTWVGAAMKEDDKGVWGAITGAVKYLLMRTLQIPTGDDPEYQTADDVGEPQAPAQPSDPVISDAQRKLLHAARKERGMTEQELKDLLLEMSGGVSDSTLAIPQRAFDAVLGRVRAFVAPGDPPPAGDPSGSSTPDNADPEF